MPDDPYSVLTDERREQFRANMQVLVSDGGPPMGDANAIVLGASRQPMLGGPTLGETIQAYLTDKDVLTNVAGWLARRTMAAVYPADPQFSVNRWFKEHADNITDQTLTRFVRGQYDDMRSERELLHVMRMDLESDDANRVIAESGLGANLIGGLTVGLRDPFNLMLGAALPKLLLTTAAREVGLAGKIGRMYYTTRRGYIGVEVAGGITAATASETINYATNRNYRVEEVVGTVFASAVLDTFIQGTFGILGRAGRQAELADALSDYHRFVDETPARVDEHLFETRVRAAEVEPTIAEIDAELQAHGVLSDVEIEGIEANQRQRQIIMENIRRWKQEQQKRKYMATSAERRAMSRPEPVVTDELEDMAEAGDLGQIKRRVDEAAMRVMERKHRESLVRIEEQLAQDRADLKASADYTKQQIRRDLPDNDERAALVEQVDTDLKSDLARVEMEAEAKKARVEESEEDYRGSHRAPTGEFGEGSFDAMDRTYPDDVYGPDAARIYGDMVDPRLDAKVAALIRKARGKPDADVTVYRAVPKGVQQEIQPGDWVTPIREYAEGHGERFDEGMDIIERTVRADELFTEGNSLFEYGWQPKQATAPARTDVPGETVPRGTSPDAGGPTGAQTMAVRMQNADDWWAETIREITGANREDAMALLDLYKRNKMVKLDVAQGRYSIKYGSAMDPQVLRATLNEIRKPAADGPDLSAMSYRDVQAEAKRLGVKASGKKDEIIARIVEAQEQPPAAMGAAAPAELDIFTRLREDTRIATPQEVDDAASAGRGIFAGASEATSNAYRNTLGRGNRLTPAASTRLSPNGAVRFISQFIEDRFVPTVGHLFRRLSYDGETLGGAMRTVNSWRQESIRSHGDLIAEIGTAIGKGEKYRRVAGKLGVREAQIDAIRINERTHRMHIALGRLERRLADAAPEGSEDPSRLANALKRRLDAEYEALGVTGEQRAKIEAAYDRAYQRRQKIDAEKLAATDSGQAIEARFQPNKELTVVQYDPAAITTPQQLDEAVRAVHELRSYANKEANSVYPDGDPAFWMDVDEAGEPVVRDSAYWIGKGLNAREPAEIREIIARLNAEEQLIRADAEGPLEAVINNRGIVWSDYDTTRVLSGLRRGATSDYFLDLVNDALGLEEDARFANWRQAMDWTDLHASKLGVNTADDAMIAESKASIGQLTKMIEHIAGRNVQPSAHGPLSGVLGFLRNMATATHLVYTPFTLGIEGGQLVAKVLARDDTFWSGLGNLNRSIAQAMRTIPKRNSEPLREILASSQALSPYTRSRGFAMSGFDPATGRGTTGFAELDRRRGAAEIMGNVMLNLSAELADLTTAGRMLDHRIPVLSNLSMDGVIRGIRTTSIFSYNRWFMERIGDFVEIDRLTRGQQAASTADAIAQLKREGRLTHNIRAADFALVQNDIGTDALEELARRQAANEGIIELMDDPWFGLWENADRAYKRHLDNVARYVDTTEPTAATIPVTAYASELHRIIYQYTSFVLAHINQNMSSNRYKPMHLQAAVFGAMLGGAAFDLFARDVVRYDWDTAVDRFEHQTRDGAARVKYAMRLIGRSGYLGVMERVTEYISQVALGDAFERQMAPEWTLTPPAIGYGKDVLRAIGLAGKLRTRKGLTWNEKELLRRLTLVTNHPLIRALGNVTLKPEMPKPRTKADTTEGPVRPTRPKSRSAREQLQEATQ